MKYSSQIYLDCYTKLHSQQSSKEANKTLLEIESSDEAWKIAQELMIQPNYNIHGSQLLSKKLNSALPPQVNPQVLAQFILSIEPISNIHWLCIAKIFVHTHQNLDQLAIQGNLGLDAKLNILKEIPYAIGQMALHSTIKQKDYIAEIYKQNITLIFQGIQFCLQNKISSPFGVQKIEDVILETLESFSQHKISLKNPQIAQFILGLSQSDKSSNLLEYIFLEQQYPQLQDKIEQFLDKNVSSTEKDWIRTFYLNYYSKKNIFQTFSLSKYEKVLTTATLMMKTDDDEQFRTLLMDSFEFWINVINNLSDKENRVQEPEIVLQKEKLLRNSLFFIFESLCKHSQLKKCPNIIKNIQSNLDIIDLDNEQGIISPSMASNLNDQYSEINYNALQIRDLSIDLFVKIEEGLKTDAQLYRKMFETFYILVSGKQDPQNIQLVVFFIDGMTDFCDQQSIPYLSELIKMILIQKQKLNQYICQKIVIMLGKIDKIIVSNLTMLPLVFQFFSNTIMYDKLSSLASESFTQLMDQYEVKNFQADLDLQFKEKSESYLNFWFQNFYGKLKNQKVLQNITKALIIFIYKFKGESFYEKFLVMMKEKIGSTDDQNLKQIYLQTVITGQNWINSRQDNKNYGYLTMFADFVSQFVQLLVNNCFKVIRKSDFSKAISKINWALKAGCYFTKIDFWISAIKQIIQKAMFEPQNQILSVALTPLITLLKSQIMTFQHKKLLFFGLKQLLQPITQLFVNYHETKTTLDYNFSKYILQIHNLTISIILKNPQISGNAILNYDPSLIFKFVKEKIFKNKTFWEYEVYKQALILMNQLVSSDYEIQSICEEVLRVCPRTLQSLWIQTENILLNIYKKQNISPFMKSFNLIKPEILPPNPLFNILIEGLQKSDRKVLKSFVRCL